MMSIPSIFISHGSPQIIMDKSSAHDFLADLQATTGQPDYIIVVSAHWETNGLKITGSDAPRTIHDFGGFDPSLHRMVYPAPGNPQLAANIQAALQKVGLQIIVDTLRGLDHGAWIPLKLAYPSANIPVLQISIPKESTPSDMYGIGKAIAPLLGHNGLLIGSGSFTHNLYEFKGQNLDAIPEKWVLDFADWMHQKITENDIESLLDYRRLAPFAKENHPTEEHLLPLFAAIGAAGEAMSSSTLHRSYNHSILAMDAYSFKTKA